MSEDTDATPVQEDETQPATEDTQSASTSTPVIPSLNTTSVPEKSNWGLKVMAVIMAIFFVLLWVSMAAMTSGDGLGKGGKDPNAEPNCIQGNVTVKREMCSAGCCTYLYETDCHDKKCFESIPYCGSQRQCDAQGTEHSAETTAPPEVLSQKGWFWTCIYVAYWVSVGVVLTVYIILGRKRKASQYHIEARKKLDEAFPPTKYGSPRRADDPECPEYESDVCCICLDGLEGTIVRKLYCNHVLHQYCFDQWCLSPKQRGAHQTVQSKEFMWTCPVCKQTASPKSHSSSLEAP